MPCNSAIPLCSNVQLLNALCCSSIDTYRGFILFNIACTASLCAHSHWTSLWHLRSTAPIVRSSQTLGIPISIPVAEPIPIPTRRTLWWLAEVYEYESSAESQTILSPAQALCYNELCYALLCCVLRKCGTLIVTMDFHDSVSDSHKCGAYMDISLDLSFDGCNTAISVLDQWHYCYHARRYVFMTTTMPA